MATPDGPVFTSGTIYIDGLAAAQGDTVVWTGVPDTIPGDTSTGYSLAIGGSATGTVSPGYDEDWFQVTLTAGERYDFALDGSGGSPLSDPYLRLYDSNGALIAYDDDGGPGYNSLLSYNASTSGTYYVSAGGWSNYIGDYTLSADIATINEWSLAQIADHLTDGFWEWFGESGRSFGTSTITYNVNGLTADGQTLARQALDAWDDVANLTFSETTGGAQIIFDDNDSGAYSTSSVSGSTIDSSLVNVSTAWLDDYGTDTYSYSYQSYVHEIGHALGLGHAGPYNGSATYGVNNIYTNDSWAYTVMSYFDQDVSGYGSDRFVMTAQLGDIVAIQNLYGAATTRTGDTTYGFNSNAGELYDLTLYAGSPAFGAPGMTIYDSAGNDTLDFSGYSNNQTINLQAATFSSVGSYTANVAIATNVTIENAIGGSGNDNITGNAFANVLNGGAGADNMTGGAGNDTFIVDSTGDQVIEGTGGGTDGVQSSVSFTLGSNVENLTLTGTANLSGMGNALANVLTGNAGDNVLQGGAGDDTLDGAQGTDTAVFGGNAADYSIAGNVDTATVSGIDGTDTLTNIEMLQFDDQVVQVGSNNSAPVAAADTASTNEDTPLTIAAATLLANDTDTDGDTLTITAVSNAVNGSVALEGNGNVVFTPNANFNGAATFDYTVSDGNAGTDTVTVIVTVNPVNDAPLAVADAASTNANTPLTIAAATLLANDTDTDGDTLTITAVSNAVNGSVALDGNGNVVFTPDANFTGAATFDYTVSDETPAPTPGSSR